MRRFESHAGALDILLILLRDGHSYRSVMEREVNVAPATGRETLAFLKEIGLIIEDLHFESDNKSKIWFKLTDLGKRVAEPLALIQKELRKAKIVK